MEQYLRLEMAIVEEAKKRICLSPAEFREYHDKLLRTITETAQNSVVYRDRVKKIESVDELNELPLIPYERIYACIKEFGLGKVLMAKPARYWQTSGYTGEPKKFYYSQNDVEEITNTYMLWAYIIGIRPWSSFWNIGGRDPLLSASLFDMSARKLKIKDCLTTPLGSQSDLFHALRKASESKRFEVLASTPFLYFLLSKAAREPSYANERVAAAINMQTKIPLFLARGISKIITRGINYENLRSIVNKAEIGLSYAEPIGPYLEKLHAEFPEMRLIDCFGSTEAPAQAVQVFSDQEGLACLLPNVVLEIAEPGDVMKAKTDPDCRANAVPWWDWKAGMRGELIVTRSGECLPLIRYPTGDLIEVLNPACDFNVKLESHELRFTLPTIRILGRSIDLVDFEVPDEKGDFIGGRIYTRQIEDALSDMANIRWWELYRVIGSPGKLVFVIIPEKEVENESEFRHKLFSKLNKIDIFLSVAFTVQLVEIIVTKPSAYKIVEKEIERRVKEGRALGQLKPRRIISVNSHDELRKVISEKVNAD